MKYRSRTDISAQILEILAEATTPNNKSGTTGGGTTKTRIMYGAYLSYAQLKEYLNILTQNGLIEYIAGEHKYRITQKGLKFLKATDQLTRLSGSE